MPPRPQWPRRALLSLAALFLLGRFSTEMADPDSWWHLATGRYIVQHRRLPVPDPFAFTTAAAPPADPIEARTERFNLTHEWLAQAAWYLVEAAGGFGAVVLWKAVLLAGMCALVGFVAGRRTGSLTWAVAAALLTSALAIEFAHDRPTILTYFFVALFLAICEERRRWWILPLLAVVWANCHGGYFLGWVVCGAYAAEALVRRTEGWWRPVAAFAAVVLVSGMNPNGYGALATVLAYRRSPMQSTLVEWTHADLWGPPYAFDLLLYAAAAVLLISWRRVRLSDWLLFVSFAAAAVLAFRNELLIGVLAPILIAAYFPGLRVRIPQRALEYAGVVALAAALVWGTSRGSFFQFRAAEWRYPAGAADFLREHAPSARIFNTYEYGGYLIWRGLPVFIDGRALRESVFEDYRKALGTPAGSPLRREAFERYGVDTIVANAFEYGAGSIYAMVPALGEPAESDWKLIYEDPAALVFMRRPPPEFQPFEKRRIADHLEAECRLHVERDPEFSLCARTLGDLFLRAGDRGRALRSLRLYLDHPYADDPAARLAYQQLLRK